MVTGCVSFSRIKNGDRSAANRFRALEEALPAPAHSMGPTRCLTWIFFFHDLNSKLWNRIKPDYFLSCLMLFVSGMEFCNLVLHFCKVFQIGIFSYFHSDAPGWSFATCSCKCRGQPCCSGTKGLKEMKRLDEPQTTGAWLHIIWCVVWHMWH